MDVPDTTNTADAARRFHRHLAWIVAAAAVWRYGHLLVSRRNRPLILNDALYYSAQAVQLADGKWFVDVLGTKAAAEHGPLTTLVLAPVSFGPEALLQQRLLTATFGVVTVALIGVLGARLAGHRVGLVAAVIAAVYPNLWMNDGLVLSESLTVMLVVMWMLAAERMLREPSMRWALTAGAMVGLAALARSEQLVLLLPTAFLAGRRAPGTAAARLGIAGATVAVTFAVIAPWTIYNLGRFERPFLLTTNEGAVLLGANCAETYHGSALGGWSLPCVLASESTNRPDDSVRTAAQRRTALAYAKANANRVPIVVAARAGRLIDVYGLDNQILQDVGEDRDRWEAWSGVFSWWLLAPLAVVGWWRSGSVARHVLGWPAAVVAATALVFYAAHRLRAPMEPSVVIAAAMTICALADRRRPVPVPDRDAG